MESMAPKRIRTKEQISYNMSKVRCAGSQIEKLFEKQLRKNKIKFKRHYKVMGKPDFVIPEKKIAIFCDSHFWHGFNWKKRKIDHKSNISFWHKKIEGNILRDKKVNRTLKKMGWIVVRFWEHHIVNEPEKCIKKILKYAKEN